MPDLQFCAICGGDHDEHDHECTPRETCPTCNPDGVPPAGSGMQCAGFARDPATDVEHACSLGAGHAGECRPAFRAPTPSSIGGPETPTQCVCDPCWARRQYGQYGGGPCCPRGLTHGFYCTCGGQSQASAPTLDMRFEDECDCSPADGGFHDDDCRTVTLRRAPAPPPAPAAAPTCVKCGRLKYEHQSVTDWENTTHFFCYEFTAKTSGPDAVAEFAAAPAADAGETSAQRILREAHAREGGVLFANPHEMTLREAAEAVCDLPEAALTPLWRERVAALRAALSSPPTGDSR